MAKYTIKWAEEKRKGSTNGRDWKITEMTLVDEQGVEIEKVSTFDTVMNGGTLEGTIETNDKGYLNFKKSTDKKPNMDRLMEKKSSQIAEAQHNKAEQIAQAQDRSAWMWAKNNASLLIAEIIKFEMRQPSYDEDEIAKRVLSLATKIYNGEPVTPF